MDVVLSLIPLSNPHEQRDFSSGCSTVLRPLVLSIQLVEH